MTKKASPTSCVRRFELLFLREGSGSPHLGQLAALRATGALHSGQETRAICDPLQFINNGHSVSHDIWLCKPSHCERKLIAFMGRQGVIGDRLS